MNRNRPYDVRIFPDLASLSGSAAALIADLSRSAAVSRPAFTMAISGGSTPKRLYELFSSGPLRDAIPWAKVHLFWVDERCVPKNHPDSNYKLAFDTFLSRVALPESNIHCIAGELEAEKAAETYESDLRCFFRDASLPVFDLVLLGIGEDGHTASLFPGSGAVREKKRWAMPVYGGVPPLNRVTLTLPVLNNAARVLFLVASREKAGVVHEILEDDNPKAYPAGMVRPAHGLVAWYVDREAAGALTDVMMRKIKSVENKIA